MFIMLDSSTILALIKIIVFHHQQAHQNHDSDKNVYLFSSPYKLQLSPNRPSSDIDQLL